MIDLEVIQEEIVNLINNENCFLDELPSDFDFKNSIGIIIKIGDSIQDNSYREDVTLELRLVGLKDKKIEIQKLARNFEIMLNKNYFESSNARVVKQNAFYTSYLDEDKLNIVLQFYILNY
ncbi:hypothetical protein [Clostridium tertium]|uniref:hypothetical protein n=1 Tax=Clostridium tertium TaxID=1559 RepID=UPI0018AB8EAF|nr:hypothetical protein [Clostridium tertium]